MQSSKIAKLIKLFESYFYREKWNQNNYFWNKIPYIISN